MSQVHSVTHVPVHSPLSAGSCQPFLIAKRKFTGWALRAGTAAEVGGGGPRAGDREDSLPPSSRGIRSTQTGSLGTGCGCVDVLIAALFNALWTSRVGPRLISNFCLVAFALLAVRKMLPDHRRCS